MKSTSLVFALAFAYSMQFVGPALAQGATRPNGEAQRSAGKHFQRGVALSGEADYAGALSEFKKANELAPNVAVLYNIGQTHFQLRGYAAALQAFERYLSEAGPTAEHRSEVEANVETLRTRVGRIDVVAPDGTDIAVDDEPVGKAPLPPLLASVGRRKLTFLLEGTPQIRFVEVSAGENTRVEVRPAEVARAASAPRTVSTPRVDPSPSVLPLALWIGAGVLAGGAATTGILALGASSNLSDERRKGAGMTSRGRLDDLESRTTRLALITDIVAGAALVTGAVAVYVSLGPHASADAPQKALAPHAHPHAHPLKLGLHFSLGRVGLDGIF